MSLQPGEERFESFSQNISPGIATLFATGQFCCPDCGRVHEHYALYDTGELLIENWTWKVVWEE
jgi:hypothetical protein